MGCHNSKTIRSAFITDEASALNEKSHNLVQQSIASFTILPGARRKSYNQDIIPSTNGEQDRISERCQDDVSQIHPVLKLPNIQNLETQNSNNLTVPPSKMSLKLASKDHQRQRDCLDDSSKFALGLPAINPSPIFSNSIISKIEKSGSKNNDQSFSRNIQDCGSKPNKNYIQHLESDSFSKEILKFKDKASKSISSKVSSCSGISGRLREGKERFQQEILDGLKKVDRRDQLQYQVAHKKKIENKASFCESIEKDSFLNNLSLNDLPRNPVKPMSSILESLQGDEVDSHSEDSKSEALHNDEDKETKKMQTGKVRINSTANQYLARGRSVFLEKEGVGVNNLNVTTGSKMRHSAIDQSICFSTFGKYSEFFQKRKAQCASCSKSSANILGNLSFPKQSKPELPDNIEYLQDSMNPISSQNMMLRRGLNLEVVTVPLKFFIPKKDLVERSLTARQNLDTSNVHFDSRLSIQPRIDEQVCKSVRVQGKKPSLGISTEIGLVQNRPYQQLILKANAARFQVSRLKTTGEIRSRFKPKPQSAARDFDRCKSCLDNVGQEASSSDEDRRVVPLKLKDVRGMTKKIAGKEQADSFKREKTLPLFSEVGTNLQDAAQ